MLAESRKRLRDLRSARKATPPHQAARLCQRCQTAATERFYDPWPEETEYDYGLEIEADEPEWL